MVKTVWVVWPEHRPDLAEIVRGRRWKAEMLALWVGLKSYGRRDPDRVVIGILPNPSPIGED